MNITDRVREFAVALASSASLAAAVDALFPGRRLRVFNGENANQLPGEADAPYVVLLAGSLDGGMTAARSVYQVLVNVGIADDGRDEDTTTYLSDLVTFTAPATLETLRQAVMAVLVATAEGFNETVNESRTDYETDVRWPLAESYTALTMTTPHTIGVPRTY